MRHGHWCDTWNHDMMSKSHADPLRILLEAIFELSQAGFVTETALWKVVEWRPVGTCWNDCTFSQHCEHCSDLTVPGLLLDIRNHHSHQCMAYTQGQNSKLHVTTTETTWNCLNTSRDPTFTCHVCNFSWSVILILILVQGPDHLTSLSCYVAMTRVVGPMLYLL